jgi:hydroxymethylbilane synthase
MNASAADLPLRLGTRGSKLARWQADWTAVRLRETGVDVELVLIETSGDVTSQPISAVGGQGLFTKEIQRSLLDHRIDLAVHSLKDLPTEPVPGLALAAVPPRESCRDAFVSNTANCIEELPSGARIGTGSRRRKSQLLHLRDDLQVLDIRGNVDTRLRKLDEGDYHGIILAEAGLKRLGWEHRITRLLPAEVMLPAVGQGALGLEIRSDDVRTRQRVEQLNDPASFASVLAERAMLAELRGGCLAPVGAWARLCEGQLQLDGVVLSSDGARRTFASATGAPEGARELGIRVATELLAQGAGELIAEARG